MIVQREARKASDEEIRLQNAKQVMYGNRDKEKDFPFDVAMRFKWVVYHESVGSTEDGQLFSKKATRRYSFFSPEQWDSVFMKKGEKSWFERNKKQFKVLHDPIEQAKKENHTIKGYYASKTGKSLAEKLANVVDADSFVVDTSKELEEKLDNAVDADNIVDVTPKEKPAPKRSAVRKGGNQ